MGHVLIQAGSLVCIIILGLLSKRLGWFSAGDFPKLSKVMLTLTLPAALMVKFDSISLDFTLLYLGLFGFGCNIIGSLINYALNRRRSPADKALAILHGGGYNIGAFAMPYLDAFLGGPSLIYSVLFDLGNSFSAAGVTYTWAMSTAKGKRSGLKETAGILLHSPVFMTYLILLLMQIFQLRFPTPLIGLASIVGSANTFVAMFMLGVGLEIKLPKEKLGRALKLLVLRYGLALVFFMLTWFLFPLPNDIKRVLCVLYFAPIAAMISGFTANCDGDVELATFFSSVTILIGIVTMPTIIMLLPA